ncbi:hypothetical protein LEMLEM_LOCUS2903 [Lemmus lemmus]
MWLSCFGPEPAGGSWSWWELASAHPVASQISDPQGVASTTTCSSITSHTQRPFLNLTFSFTIPSRFSHWPRSCTLGTISLMSPTTSFDCCTTRSCFCGSTHRTSMGLREHLVSLPQSWLKLMGLLHQLRVQSVEGPSRGRTYGWSLLLACLKQYRSQCPDCSSIEIWWVLLLGVLAARMWPSWVMWLKVWKGWWTSWAGHKSCRISSSGKLERWMDRTDKTIVTCGKVTQEILSREPCLETARTGLQIWAKPRVTWVTVF